MGIETGLAIGGLIYKGISMHKQFKQAKDMKNKAEAADAEAARLLQGAKDKLSLNFFEEVALQKTPYDVEREAVLSQAAGVLEAGKEAGVRGISGTAGRVLAGQQAAQSDITKRQVEELQQLDTLVASEDSRLRDLLTQIELKEAEGAQKAAAELEAKATQSKQKGLNIIPSLVGDAINTFVPLFPGGGNLGGELNVFKGLSGIVPGGSAARQGDPNTYTLSGDAGFDLGLGESSRTSYSDFFGDMSVSDYKTWKEGLSPTDYSAYFNEPFRQAYEMNMAKSPYNFMNPFLEKINLPWQSGAPNAGQLSPNK